MLTVMLPAPVERAWMPHPGLTALANRALMVPLVTLTVFAPFSDSARTATPPLSKMLPATLTVFVPVPTTEERMPPSITVPFMVITLLPLPPCVSALIPQNEMGLFVLVVAPSSSLTVRLEPPVDDAKIPSPAVPVTVLPLLTWMEIGPLPLCYTRRPVEPDRVGGLARVTRDVTVVIMV